MNKMPVSQNFEFYGKVREPKRNRKPQPQQEEAKNEKESKEKQQGFLETFHGEKVALTLITGEKLTGILTTNRYNKFDVLLDSILVPKHAILCIQKIDGGDER